MIVQPSAENGLSFVDHILQKPWVDMAIVVSATALAIVGGMLLYSQVTPLLVPCLSLAGAIGCIPIEILWRLSANAISSVRKTAQDTDKPISKPAAPHAPECSDKGVPVKVHVKALKFEKSYDSTTPLQQVQKDLLEKLKEEQRAPKNATLSDVSIFHGGKKYNPSKNNSSMTVEELTKKSGSVQLMCTYTPQSKPWWR